MAEPPAALPLSAPADRLRRRPASFPLSLLLFLQHCRSAAQLHAVTSDLRKHMRWPLTTGSARPDLLLPLPLGLSEAGKEQPIRAERASALDYTSRRAARAQRGNYVSRRASRQRRSGESLRRGGCGCGWW